MAPFRTPSGQSAKASAPGANTSSGATERAGFSSGTPLHRPSQTDRQLDILKQRVLEATVTVSYPARRDTLVDSAIEHQAQADVVAALRALPDESFGSFNEVSASIAVHV